MGDNDQVDLLRDWWLECLMWQGHGVAEGGGDDSLIQSGYDEGRRYRWMLLVSDEPVLCFGEQERARIRLQIRQARRLKENPYLVVGFLSEPQRVVVVPAAKALKVGCVRSDKGGIAWED